MVHREIFYFSKNKRECIDLSIVVSKGKLIVACFRPSVGGVSEEKMRGSGSLSFPDSPRSRFCLDSLAFFTRRCCRSLPPIESPEQAKLIVTFERIKAEKEMSTLSI